MAALPKSLCDREQDKFCEDSAGKTAVRVCADTDPLPVTFSGATGGTKIHVDGSGTGIAGSAVTLISFSVPVSTTRRLTKVIVSCRRSGLVEIEAGGARIGTKRISAAEMDAVFEWNPTRDIAAGTIVEVKYTQFQGTGSDVDAHLMATDV